MEQLKKNTSLSRAYGEFISQFDWRYFMTCRHRYKLSEKTIRKWTDKLFKASLSISRIYWVMKRDKEDSSSKHVHMLLEYSEEITQNQLKKALNVSVGHFGEIESTIGVSN